MIPIMKFPANVMYWVRNDDGTFEILDGSREQLVVNIYGDFSFKNRTFHNLTVTEQQQILDYQCMIYFSQGNDKEKLDWFKIINIAGEKLTEKSGIKECSLYWDMVTSAKKYLQ